MGPFRVPNHVRVALDNLDGSAERVLVALLLRGREDGNERVVAVGSGGGGRGGWEWECDELEAEV